MKLGLAGRVAKIFVESPITPLFMLSALAVGLLALVILPREEDPQISVPLVDISIQIPGLKAEDAVELITKPLEDIIKGIDDVDHVYSYTRDDKVLVTARFNVNHSPDSAIVRVHEKIQANINLLPVGASQPVVVGRGINDVAIMVITLSPKAGNEGRWTSALLYNLAEELQHEMGKVSNVGSSYIVGGEPPEIRIEPNPELLSLYGVTLNQVVEKVRNANRAFVVGEVNTANQSFEVVAGQTLQGPADIGLLLITTVDGRPVYLRDIGKVVIDGPADSQRAWHFVPDERVEATGRMASFPAVSLAIAKREGSNAVTIAADVLDRLEIVRGDMIPEGVNVTISRNYGISSKNKADELLLHMVLASLSIGFLIFFFIGWREAGVVLLVIPTTILLTFFFAWAVGLTINRVSMFGLILSIGILADDAIVVIDNISRHWEMRDGRTRLQSTIDAVSEVGNPTIIATFTVIVAMVPMMFVTGIIGPYFWPIPAIAATAMFFSLLVAVIVAPWMMMKFKTQKISQDALSALRELIVIADLPDLPQQIQGFSLKKLSRYLDVKLERFYTVMADWLLVGRSRSLILVIVVFSSTVLCTLFLTERVIPVKLMAYDDKMEIGILVDLPEGSSLESTERVMFDAVDRIKDLPHLTSIQNYIGTYAPFNFNGLVRQTYMRRSAEQGEVQINLTAKHSRDIPSKDLAIMVRSMLEGLPVPPGTTVKVIEVPPGPPTPATMLAEVYGPDPQFRRELAEKLKKSFDEVDYVIAVDDSYGSPAKRMRISLDQENLEFHRVEEGVVYDTISALMGEVLIGYSHRGGGANPVAIVVRQPKAGRSVSERLSSTPVPNMNGDVVELGDVVHVSFEPASYPIYRRDGRAAEMVTGDLIGRFDASIYAISDIEESLLKQDWGEEGPPDLNYWEQPDDESFGTILWQGRWELVFRTYRDLAVAFSFAVMGIYMLVVAQFGSFKLPLLVLVPVPLTLPGIILGHWVTGDDFGGPSLMGLITASGIVVRNSILLIEFIRQRQAEGASLRSCLMDAGAVRFKPIFLTGVAAMIGAAFILADSIFRGMALSLLFGLTSSTLLTVLVIPAIYILMRDDHIPLEQKT